MFTAYHSGTRFLCLAAQPRVPRLCVLLLDVEEPHGVKGLLYALVVEEAPYDHHRLHVPCELEEPVYELGLLLWAALPAREALPEPAHLREGHGLGCVRQYLRVIVSGNLRGVREDQARGRVEGRGGALRT